MVGIVFLSEGVQKFLFPEDRGIGRFSEIGIGSPELTAPFVAVIEIVFGTLIIFGLLARLSTIPLLIDICVAIIMTKLPILIKGGFWEMMHASRVDFCMLFGLVFILINGAGALSFDARLKNNP
jgi:uncharacterized membrane protein YphA (DoxX/SURF4 family)